MSEGAPQKRSVFLAKLGGRPLLSVGMPCDRYIILLLLTSLYPNMIFWGDESVLEV